EASILTPVRSGNPEWVGMAGSTALMAARRCFVEAVSFIAGLLSVLKWTSRGRASDRVSVLRAARGPGTPNAGPLLRPEQQRVQADPAGDPVRHPLGELSCREDPAEMTFGHADPIGEPPPGQRLAC